jgi:class 3 adenylate cyclase
MSADLADEVWKNRALFLTGRRPLPMRLQSTVLFADLVGSTRIGGTMEPGDFMAWIGKLLDRLAQVAAAHHGFVEKFTGDGIMVVFGAPLPRMTVEENAQDATLACDCALQMSAAVDDLNQSRSTTPAYQIRIGIHAGSVLGGSVGSASRMQYTIIGDAANIAARVEAFGKKITSRTQRAATICVTENVKDLIGQGFCLEALGTLTHDEGTRTISIYLLTGRSDRGEGWQLT